MALKHVKYHVWNEKKINEYINEKKKKKMQMEEIHEISNQDQGTDTNIEITKNYIRRRAEESIREADVKIIKE